MYFQNWRIDLIVGILKNSNGHERPPSLSVSCSDEQEVDVTNRPARKPGPEERSKWCSRETNGEKEGIVVDVKLIDFSFCRFAGREGVLPSLGDQARCPPGLRERGGRNLWLILTAAPPCVRKFSHARFSNSPFSAILTVRPLTWTMLALLVTKEAPSFLPPSSTHL